MTVNDFSCDKYHDCFSCPIDIHDCPNWKDELGKKQQFYRNKVTNQELLDYKRRGYKLKDVAKITGLSEDGIRNRIGVWSPKLPTRKEVKDLFKSSMTQEQVAKYFGFDVSTLRVHGFFKGWQHRGHRKYHIDYLLVEELRKDMTLKDISKLINVPYSALSKRMKSYSKSKRR